MRFALGRGRVIPADTSALTGSDVIERVKRLISQHRLRRARALTEDLAARPGAEVATDVCRALLAVNGSMPEVGWTLLTRHDADAVLRVAPVTLVRAGLVGHEDATRDLIIHALDDPTWSPEPDELLAIARLLLAAGELHTADAVLTRFCDDLKRHRPRRYEVLDRWLRKARAESSPDVDAGDASFVLWDYEDLDATKSPRSVAPYVDSLCTVVTLSRHAASLRCDDPAVQSVCDQVVAREHQVDRVTSPPGRGVARLHVVPRQASHLVNVPEGTWALVSGPLVRGSGELRARFPFNPSIRPIFTGVHVNPDTLGRSAAVDYLRESGPVGCVDWNSVFLLRAAEVPAFFSGPMTVTLGALASGTSRQTPAEARGREKISWSDPAAHTRSIGDNLRAALDAVDEVAWIPGGSTVRTGDVDAFWVARSMQLDARLRLGRKAPVRDIGGDMSDGGLHDLAVASADRLRIIVSAILSGETEQEVRRRWREACAPAVAVAEERAQSLRPLESVSWSVDELCADVRSRSVIRDRSVEVPGAEVSVEVSLDGRLKHQLGVVLDSMVRHSDSPIRLHVLCREHDERDFTRMADLFPEVSFFWLPTDTATYGQIGGLLRHISVASMDRLLLPGLLPEVHRIIHHDLDAVCRADLADLFGMDLAGAPLAARDQLQPHGGSFYRSFAAQAERRFRDRPELGSELLLRLSMLHPFDPPAFNSGVMVMDLERMRADNFLQQFLPWVTRFGLNDQVLLNAYAGSTRAPLPYEWNHFPRIEVPLDDPKIVHWIGAQKPWAVPRTPARRHWVEAEAHFSDRTRRRGQAAAR